MLQIVEKKIIHFFRRNLHSQTLVLPVSCDLIGNMMEFFVVRNARSEIQLQRILLVDLSGFFFEMSVYKWLARKFIDGDSLMVVKDKSKLAISSDLAQHFRNIYDKSRRIPFAKYLGKMHRKYQSLTGRR